MRKLRLYLDTSVINFLFADDAPDLKKATQVFFAEIEHYDVYISDVVVREIMNTKSEQKQKKLTGVIKQYKLKLLEIDDIEEVARLAQCYLDQGAIPIGKREDAQHVAYAVIAEMDFLVSWNYKHLANANKEFKIVLVNQREGYFYPFRLTTPMGVKQDES